MNHQSIFDFFGTIEMLLRACHGPYVTIATILYAKQDMFGFVLHFNVGFNDKDSEILKKSHGGADRRGRTRRWNVLSALPIVLF